MNFQRFIANIALLILALALVVIGITIYRSKNKFVGDDVIIGECPDYWVMKNINNKNICVNTKNLGNKKCSSKMNFMSRPWSSVDGNCKKYNWAKKCDLTWDGITNNPNSCKK